MKNKTSNDLNVETKRKCIQSAIGKDGMKFIEFTTKVSKFLNFRFFRQQNPIFDPFREVTSVPKIIGSELKRVAIGSVSKRYQTSLSVQLSKNLLGNGNSDLICPMFNVRKPPSKITRCGVHLRKKILQRYFVGYNGVNIQQQLNSVSSRLVFEETSVDSCQKVSRIDPEVAKIISSF